ncbi:glycosyltransferase [Azospirillum picis]|uniref:Colanic acid biosynthesis glycosyltransferase n=1 Tax=Azospirillum picis TaxID=488438 RepID=A0ABU0MGM2_9PROT|nr:glycosyltransferase [Azospirillum picis]MBP2298356.1 putative colanic acid biosynthesis glycosyltransferase [Azospirillum picis]MDQ0532595.1 putative colanic acid biosynthesis glycosyltransferase [Azospirillum picis]
MSPTVRHHRLAILTVVRDDRAGLADTCDSLRGQLGPQVAWFVADGASSDGTSEWLERHAALIDWRRSAPDSGIYDAMNHALDAARRSGCSHALFLNAGDRLADGDTIGRLLDAIGRHAGSALLYGDALERLEDGRILLKRARSHRLASFGMFTHHQAMIYRIECLQGIRFDTGFRIAADYAFTLAVLARGNAVRLPVAVCQFRHGGLSQREADEGRREQTRIRRDMMGYGRLRLLAIASAQRTALTFRRLFPATYTKLRFERPEI